MKHGNEHKGTAKSPAVHALPDAKMAKMAKNPAPKSASGGGKKKMGY